MNKKITVLAISSVFLLSMARPVPSVAEDTSFRCGSETVSVGDSTYVVQKACGKPARTEKTGTAEKAKKEKIALGKKTSKGKSTRVEKWYYDEGYGGYVYILTFQGGALKKIEKGGRGK
ncbi:MAG: DUF2845 domain-containing protein [Deltaproteobacteria bacterium]|nr:DUF2845 domain-containing protein [Deltaproteobacteria bacterium]